MFSKAIADFVNVSFFGDEWGSLQSYALAFSLGGLAGGVMNKLGTSTFVAGKVLRFGIKYGSKVIANPVQTQAINIGLGENASWNLGQFGYDMVTRGLISFIPGSYKISSVFGKIKIAPFKAIARGTARGLYKYIGPRLGIV